jgi:predicted aspartyl protease
LSDGGLVVVDVRVYGPTGESVLRLALDTGATQTVIDPSLLMMIGYDPSGIQKRLKVTTGSRIEFAAELPLSRINALGEDRMEFKVICHTLPPSAGVNGLLGLDFFQNRILAIDFRSAKITLS